MTDDRDGQVVTFYSFKGGTGRTMALANVAWILAANGQRVLVVDWDLESPGLHRFFRPFLSEAMLSSSTGVIDLIRSFERAARDHPEPQRLARDVARVQRYTFSLNRRWQGGGTLDFLAAGRQNLHYSAAISGLNWDHFYQKLGGGFLFDALREDMKRSYDYTLIDSRTGWSDVADICTVHLPDTVVACFTLSDQGIDGTAQISQQINRRTSPRPVRVLPVAMRIDAAEKEKVEIGLSVARQRFTGLPAHLDDAELTRYWARTRVPYQSFYAYEEIPATVGDEAGTVGLLSAFETVTAAVTNGRVTRMPALDTRERLRLLEQYTRLAAQQEREVTLRYDLDGVVWAEWISVLLKDAGVAVHDPGPSADPEGAAALARQLVIHTAPYERPISVRRSADGRTPLVVYVTDPRSSSTPLTGDHAARVSGLAAEAAADRILKLVGLAAPTEEQLQRAPRFPGQPPRPRRLPPRNKQFAGRTSQLDRLRGLLRRDVNAAHEMVSPIVLHGTGGIGKTQLALEYAHLFQSAYDLVCWIDADSTAEPEQSLYDLGMELGLGMPTSIADGAQVVRATLSRAEPPYARWLLIFDNAEDLPATPGDRPAAAPEGVPDRLARLIPSGGDVLITARDESQWSEQARLVPVGAFEREESIAYLRAAAPRLTRQEAERLARLLDDLPIAVALAAAWLKETGAPVEEYLEAVEKGELGDLATEESLHRVDATWGVSLDQLERRSAAAYRLLELCAVTTPEVPLDLLYSDAMLQRLQPYDPTLSDKLMLGRPVSLIRRLALLQIDQGVRSTSVTESPDAGQGGHVVVHRLVQYAVRKRMTAEEIELAQHDVHLVLTEAAKQLGDVASQKEWPRFRTLWPHVEATRAVTCTSAPVRQLLVDWVRYSYQRADPARGLAIAQEAEAEWTTGDLVRLLDDEGRRQLLPQLLQLRFNRANILRDQGAFTESLQLDEQVLAQQTELLGEDHPHRLMTAGSLAADLRGLGRYAQALATDERTCQAWESFDEDQNLRLNALSNLAVSHRLMGRLPDALELDERVYAARQRVLGVNDLFTLLSGASLGRDLREMGEFERSVALLTEIVDRYTEVLGPGSRLTVNARVNLAISLRAVGRPTETAQLLDGAYQQLVELVGTGHPDALACRLSRSLTLLELDEDPQNLPTALTEIRAVRAAYQQRLTARHPHVLVCLCNLAAGLRQQGDLAAARPRAEEALTGLREVLYDEHPYALAAQMNLAVVDADLEDYESALRGTRAAATSLARVLGPDHPHTLRCQANLAIILLRARGAGYQDSVDQAIERFGQRVGATHRAVKALRSGRLMRRIIDPHPF